MPVPVPDFSALLGQELRGLKMGIPSNYYFDIIDPEVETASRQSRLWKPSGSRRER